MDLESAPYGRMLLVNKCMSIRQGEPSYRLFLVPYYETSRVDMFTTVLHIAYFREHADLFFLRDPQARCNIPRTHLPKTAVDAMR